MKGAVFQREPKDPSNPHWTNVATGNAALAATQSWKYPLSWTRNYYVEIDPFSEGYALPGGIDFIPSIFGDVGCTFGSECTQANVDRAVQTTTTGELYCFGEPNHVDQANMTPARCAALWPMIRASGLRITSPVIALATSDPVLGTPGDWISQFVTAVGSADWDVTAIDVYADITGFNPSTNAAAIAAHLDAAHAAYGKPVWLMETGMISFSSLPSNPNNLQVESYMRLMIKICKERPWVERYCWYRIGPGDATFTGYNNITLYSETGVQTAIGRYFANLW
jgi:hypothetical protein